tara:strand:- start:3900 stop:4100 length:201 start_codon:yes stop_codon:yes gene_type:complete
MTGDYNSSKKAEFEAHQAANLVKFLSGERVTGLTAVRILKIAAYSIEVNVCDAERITHFQSESNKP